MLFCMLLGDNIMSVGKSRITGTGIEEVWTSSLSLSPHHMAYDTTSFCHSQSFIDLESFRLTDSEMELPFFLNSTKSETVYLEDAISKLPHFSDRMNSQNLLENQEDPLLNFTSMEEDYYSLADSNKPGDEQVQEAIHSSEESPLVKGAMAERSSCIHSSKKKMAYPFDAVKAVGYCEVSDAVTLEDINHRILSPPKKAVPHPVGEYGTHPCVSPHGFGISGKPVVALTKIHTRGGGTITIIRT